MYNPITKDKKGKKKKLFDLRRFNKVPKDDDVIEVKKAVKQIADASNMSVKEIPKKPLVYYNNKKKETLYGYSQHNLDSLVKLLQFIIILFGIFSIVIFFLMLYVFYIFQRYHVLTQIIQALQ